MKTFSPFLHPQVLATSGDESQLQAAVPKPKPTANVESPNYGLSSLGSQPTSKQANYFNSARSAHGGKSSAKLHATSECVRSATTTTATAATSSADEWNAEQGRSQNGPWWPSSDACTRCGTTAGPAAATRWPTDAHASATTAQTEFTGSGAYATTWSTGTDAEPVAEAESRYNGGETGGTGSNCDPARTRESNGVPNRPSHGGIIQPAHFNAR